MDRANFRVPNKISDKHGRRDKCVRFECILLTACLDAGRPLQKGLGSHVDCNPFDMFTLTAGEDGKKKVRWRPIQSFVALTDIRGKVAFVMHSSLRSLPADPGVGAAPCSLAAALSASRTSTSSSPSIGTSECILLVSRLARAHGFPLACAHRLDTKIQDKTRRPPSNE